MPKPCKLKEIDGAMWARLDIDWDGGPVSLYTEIELREMKKKWIEEVVYVLNNLDRVTYYDV